MNRSIRLVSLFAIILTAILLVNLTVIQAFLKINMPIIRGICAASWKCRPPARPNLCG